MYKKTLTISTLCLLTTLSYASTELCGGLRVRIRNYSAYDCTLVNNFVINGTTYHDTSVPSVIYRWQSVFFDIKKGPGSRRCDFSNVLTYQCGDDHTISLYSMRFSGRHHGILTDFSVLDANHMSATPKEKKEDCDDWTSAYNYNTIEWTINDMFN